MYNGAEYKNSKQTDSQQMRVMSSQNLSIDVSQKDKCDFVYARACNNMTLKLDEKDIANVRVFNDNCGATFICNEKGTYELKVSDECVKRSDVPAVLLTQYERIAKKNKNNTICEKSQVEEFKKIVQEAFDNKQITQEEAEKMGFNSHSVYDHFKYTQKFATTCTKPIEDKMANKHDLESLKDLGLAFVGAAVGFVSGATGLVVDACREGYDLVSGEMGQQTVFTHWATDGDYIEAKPVK